MERLPRWELPEVVSRAGHQLRNPLATIQSGIQLVQVLTRPEGEVADYLEGALLEVARIDLLLRDLQQLVRLAPSEPTRAGLRDTAEQAVARCAAPVTAVRLEGPGELETRLDADLLQVALGALIQRAAAVTPAGQEVVVRWGVDEDGPVWVEVDDGGPSDPSGSLRPVLGTWPGSGLGPYLAERACALLGGDLEWEAVHPRGHRFRIVLQRG